MPNRLAIVFATVVLAAVALSGCGQKGPLQLPSQPAGQTPAY